MRKGNSAENARRGCASFVVIPAIERESPSVCENASRVSRHCVGNAPPTLPYPVILNGNAVKNPVTFPLRCHSSSRHDTWLRSCQNKFCRDAQPSCHSGQSLF